MGFHSAMPIELKEQLNLNLKIECHLPTYRLFRTVYILQREGGEYYN